jgi:decaprenylphospho-beta-D-erythro-pentofuranosid-2-ulose 2-reductase
MNNAFGQPQNIVVLGGTSDIGLAIARDLLSASTKHVVLACRNLDAGEAAAVGVRQLAPAASVDVVHFDASDTASHEALLSDLAAQHGDLDVVVLAFGQLGDNELVSSDPVAAAELAHVNFSGAVSASIATTKQLRAQGHGALVILSSVAGERVRKGNLVYGATKAGLDGFAQALGDSLVGTGVQVLIVRPGFVHSAMTAGMKAAPFATTPDKVAALTVAGLRSGKRIVWAPGILRFVFMTLRHMPSAVWRRLPLG